MICQSMGFLVPTPDAGEEDVFEIGGAGSEAVAGRLVGKDVEQGAAADEAVGNDAAGLLIAGHVGFSDGALPDAAVQSGDDIIRGAFKQDAALVDDGHFSAEIG